MNSFRSIVAVASLVVLGAAGSAFAQFTVQPQEFDPNNLCDITAEWQNGVIVLAKNCPTATEASAQIEIVSPLETQDISNLTELNFDVQGHCGAGAPRFNVVVDGQTYFLGCAYGTHTDLGNGWTHVEFTAADFALASPGPIPTTGTLEDLYIVFDEGTDTPPSDSITTPGTAMIDNISVNGETVGDSAKPASKDDCKNGGWRNFQDPSFKNQGQCVSWVVSHRGGNH